MKLADNADVRMSFVGCFFFWLVFLCRQVYTFYHCRFFFGLSFWFHFFIFRIVNILVFVVAWFSLYENLMKHGIEYRVLGSPTRGSLAELSVCFLDHCHQTIQPGLVTLKQLFAFYFVFIFYFVRFVPLPSL